MRYFRRPEPLIAGRALAIACAAALFASPTFAPPVSAQANEKVSVEDVAVQPLRDVNIRQDEIPALLIEAMADPYSIDLVSDCDSLVRLIGYYDNVLGADVDLPDEDTLGDKRRRSASNIAKSVVGGVIPFRSVVREVTGANDKRRLQREAIAAGLMRRAFLKGIGLEKGCAYPARPATGVVAFDRDAHERMAEERKQAARAGAPGTEQAEPAVGIGTGR